MNSLPTDIINLILEYVPNIMNMRINIRLNNIVRNHEEYKFWLLCDIDKIYKFGKVKMFDSNNIQINLNKLSIACKYGNLGITKYLVSLGATTNYALMIASKYGT